MNNINSSMRYEKFGKLTVLYAIPGRTSGGHIKWMCKCDCGKEGIHVGFQLRNGKIRSCGCLRKSKDEQVSNEKHMLQDYKYRAQKLNLEFSITLKEFQNLVRGNCFYCKSGPTTRKSRGNRKTEIKSNGIDRFMSSLGYTSKNCVTCCDKCNMFKNDLSLHEFLEHVKQIASAQGWIL